MTVILRPPEVATGAGEAEEEANADGVLAATARREELETEGERTCIGGGREGVEGPASREEEEALDEQPPAALTLASFACKSVTMTRCALS